MRYHCKVGFVHDYTGLHVYEIASANMNTTVKIPCSYSALARHSSQLYPNQSNTSPRVSSQIAV